MISNQGEYDYDYLFKLVLIGDANVGKTSLLRRFADDNFEGTYISTVGVDFRFRTVTIDDKLVKLQIWDTAGQERFRQITSAYYRGANGVILVYDITSKESFNHVQHWLDEVHKSTTEAVTKLVVGNKADLVSKREVEQTEAQNYADSVHSQFVETSAKTAANVDKAFFIIGKTLLTKKVSKSEDTKDNEQNNVNSLTTAKKEENKNECCTNCLIL